MDIKDSYLHGTVGVVKSISVTADKLKYKLADKKGTSIEVTMPTATQSANGLLSSTDKKKLDSITGPSLSIPYIVGPDTDTTAGTWTGSYSGITTYTEGLTIIYVPKVAGASTTTLNINGLGAKTCYYTGTSKLTTHYAAGTPILFTYSGGAWKRADYYTDSNTYTSAYCTTSATTAAKTASCSNYTLKANSYIHILIRYANTVAGALTLNINSTGAKPIYINGTASSASNYTLPAGTYIVYYDGTNFYFRTDGILPGKIEKTQLSDLVTCTAGSGDVYRPIVVYTSNTRQVYHNAKITANYVSGDLKATSFTGTFKGTADKVANSLILKINSGTTEGTSLYTYNGSAAKTLNIKNGTGIGFTNTAGVLSIYNSGVRSISTGTANGTISVNTNGTSTNVAVKGLGSAAYTNSSAYAVRQTLSTEDLNTVTTPGFYNCGGGNTCTNKPEGVDHFGMYVIHCASGTYYVQILFEEADSTKQWRRHCIAGTWSTWTLDKLSDTTYSVVSNSANGLAPKVINTNTATVGTAYYVLASTNGSATPSWYKLPANAFVNDDTKVTQTNTTTSASYRVLFSGNANDTTETTTARKSANLTFNPSTGTLNTPISNITNQLVIANTGNAKHILFSRGKDTDYQYNYIAAPEGGYICILPNGVTNSSTSGMQFTDEGLRPATNAAYSLGTTTLKWNNVYATTFKGNLDGTYVNKLTGYSKATSASNIAATDTLKSALGKLEYKAHYAYDWVIGVTATDTDEYINKWGEIVGFLDSVKEGTDILDEFVTRKTNLTITGTKTFSKVINSANSGGSWVSGMTNASIKYDSLNALNASNYHPIIGVKTNGENVVNLGAYINDVGFYGYKKGRTDNSYDWLFKFNSETGAITHTGTSITAAKFITSGGTSSQFVKGDGSLDSNKYLINTHSTHTNACYRTLVVNGSDYAFWSPFSTKTFSIYSPTTAGTKYLILVSNGSGAPVWSELSNITAGSLKPTVILASGSSAFKYVKFASINLTLRYAGKYAVLKLAQYFTTSTNYANSCDVHVHCYQWDEMGVAPEYTIQTNNDDNLFEIIGIVNYSTTNSTLDLYVYGKGSTYKSINVTTIIGDNIISIGSNIDSLPTGTIVIPTKMGHVAAANNGIFYIGGTGTTAGTWLGSHTGITSYYVGLTIAYKIPIAGASTTTLNINSLGAKTCYINTSKLTTHYGVGSVAILVYDGTYFRTADYDSTTTKVRLYLDTSAKEYPLAFRYDNTAANSSGYVNEYLRYASAITVNPSTGNITVGSVTTSTIKSDNTILYLRYNNDNANSVCLMNSAFIPTDGSNNKINLGKSSNRWKSLYTSKLEIDSTGKLMPIDDNSRSAGVYGVYDSTKVGHVWSIGSSYKISDDGRSTGNMYGLVYFYTDWSNSTEYNTATREDKLITEVDVYASGHLIAMVSNGEIMSSLGNHVWSRHGFIKLGSSDSYVLLGGGGHKTISSLSVASAVTADYLKPTKIVSGVKFSLSNASWTDTGYTFASLTTGTYAVQVASGSNLVASGIMSVYTNLSDTAGDEIPLHVYGTAGWRPYLRTHDNKLLISSNDISETSRTVTIKIALIL